MSKAGMGLHWEWVEVDVAELRGARTATDAALMAGVGRRTWQRWESAGRMPKDALERFKTSASAPPDTTPAFGRTWKDEK